MKWRSELFWSHVIKTDACWLWSGYRRPNGYASISINYSPVYVHRYAYSLIHGPIPAGLFVCHSCDVRHCVNPDHLWLGTAADNLKDMARKGRGCRGERNYMRQHPEAARGERNATAKLTTTAVHEIRRRYGEGELLRKIAADHGVSPTHIVRIGKLKARAYE